MMNSIATYKESLSRISSEVFDAAEELDIPQPRREDSPASGRRISQRSSRFTSPVASSPMANGIRTDSGSPEEIVKYKADIQRLQASEAELKAFSSSYAAMLKEKEEQLSKLREENGSLRKSLDGKESLGNVLRDESTKAVSNNLKATIDRSLIRSHRNSAQGNSRCGSHSLKSSPTKKDGFSNGGMQAVPLDATHQTITNSQESEKELKKLLEEIRSLTTLQANHESEIKRLRAQLDSERETASTTKLKLQEECQLNESSHRELQHLKIEKERTFSEMKELQKELREKILESKQLQAELSRKGMEEPNDSSENLKSVISVLENENAKLKIEKSELETSLKLHINSTSQYTSNFDEKVVEEMEVSMRKTERSLEDAHKERDRALHELNRLKQHLLEKELEDSDKMDEDSKIIEELRATTEYQQARILQLENALKQEVTRAEEIKNSKCDELRKANEVITELKQKLANCMSVVDLKNTELQNLQTALGQYYAESDAKERLGRDLAATKEKSAKLFDSLKAANQELELSKREKEEMVIKLSHAERMLSEGKRAIQKLEEDNSKLRRALEQNMTRLNRMSMDSDNYVDREIIAKRSWILWFVCWDSVRKRSRELALLRALQAEVLFVVCWDSQAVLLEASWEEAHMKHLLDLLITSLLQICGWTFFSKKQKKEREGSQKKLQQLECHQVLKRETEPLLQGHRVPLTSHHRSLKQTCLQDSSRTSSIQILNLQRFLSLRLLARLQETIPQECLQDIEKEIVRCGIEFSICTKMIDVPLRWVI